MLRFSGAIVHAYFILEMYSHLLAIGIGGWRVIGLSLKK